MNFKTLLKIINEESRETADSFRTTGEANAKEKAASSGDDKAKDAARKRAERAKKVPRERKAKAELIKEVMVVKTNSGRVQLIFKDSFNKSEHQDLSKGQQISLEDAKKAAADPNFEQTRASKLILGDVKSKAPSEKKEKKEEEKGEKKEKKPEAEGEKKADKKAAPEEEKPRRLSKEEMFSAMQQMSPEQLATLPPEVREEYFKQLRNPPSNQNFDNFTFEGLSVQFGISPISSLPFNQQVLNALLFISKLKVGASDQEMQTFSTLNPGSTDFTKRAYLQASKILSQIGDECISNLVSAAEANQKQMYTEGSVDMKCGEYKFKIEAGGEFTVSTDKLNQSNKLFKGILSNALNSAFTDQNVLQNDPGVKKMMGTIEQKTQKVSTLLIAPENLPLILQNKEFVQQLQNTPVTLKDGTQAGMVLDEEGNLNPAASMDSYVSEIQKASKSIFKKETNTETSLVANKIAGSILKSYLRGDGIKPEEMQPNHLVTSNGIFAMSDAYFEEISKNAIFTVKPSAVPLDSENIENYKKGSVESLKKWRALIEAKEQQKQPKLKDLVVPIESINPLEVASQYLQSNMDFEFNGSLIPGFKPKDLNTVEYNYVRIGDKVTKIPVVRADRLANQLTAESYMFMNDLLVEALTNNFVLSDLVKINLITHDEQSVILSSNMLNESSSITLKDIFGNMLHRAATTPIKIALAEKLVEAYKRDYKMEYRNYHGKAKQRKERAARTKAREIMKKKGLAKKGDGKDIDHKRPLRSGGSNGINNLRKRNKSENRSDNGHHKGEKQNKDWK